MLITNLQLFACNEVNCTGGCIGGCGTFCVGQCSGCGLECSGCGGCDSVCNVACSVNCSGCTGCTSCNGCSGCTNTCLGDCNNACLADSASAVIVSLGANIVKGNIIRSNDFSSLKNAIHNELVRRSKTIPNDSYNVSPAVNVLIAVEHAQHVFDDINVMDVTKFKTITLNNITVATTYSESITYIQTLMNQNIK